MPRDPFKSVTGYFTLTFQSLVTFLFDAPLHALSSLSPSKLLPPGFIFTQLSIIYYVCELHCDI